MGGTVMTPRAAAAPAPVEPSEEELAAEHRARVLEQARASWAGPGVYNWPGEAYHADPVPGGSARSTVLRRIIRDGGPARVAWEAEHPQHSDAFDFGGAAHKLILGTGDEIVEVVADDWRTNAAKAARREARAAGRRPILSKDLRRAEALAAAVLAHPVARWVMSPDVGVHEQTVVWQDNDTGVHVRAMLDVFPVVRPGRTAVVADLKTTTSVDRRHISRSWVDYGYHQQGALILDGLASVGITDVDLLWVLVEKDPPHLVRVARMPDQLLELGRARNRRALDVWAWCQMTGEWPGLAPVIDEIDAPGWAYRDEDEDQ